MIKPGDTVRYLNAVGGGTVTRVDGKIAYVDDNGFETPMLAAELVVVMPAGHTAPAKGAKLMFDQSARDAAINRPAEPEPKPKPQTKTQPATETQPAETKHGDKLNIALAFEPSSTRELDKATFNAVLVNDSNYTMLFSFAGRGSDDNSWTLIYRGEVMPNELIDIQQFTHESIHSIERISIQAVAFKTVKPFEMKQPVNIVRKLDLTKFHKLHCFRPGIYFDTPVLELQLIKDDAETGRTIGRVPHADEDAARQLAEKYRVDFNAKKKPAPERNPNRPGELIEVDLHINQLLDSTAGMDNNAMMQVQLDTVRRTMNDNSRRIGQKIVFIHGKGDGVLRKAVLNLIAKEFPKATTQDASFREYGFGATLVTIH